MSDTPMTAEGLRIDATMLDDLAATLSFTNEESALFDRAARVLRAVARAEEWLRGCPWERDIRYGAHRGGGGEFYCEDGSQEDWSLNAASLIDVLSQLPEVPHG